MYRYMSASTVYTWRLSYEGLHGTQERMYVNLFMDESSYVCTCNLSLEISNSKDQMSLYTLHARNVSTCVLMHVCIGCVYHLWYNVHASIPPSINMPHLPFPLRFSACLRTHYSLVTMYICNSVPNRDFVTKMVGTTKRTTDTRPTLEEVKALKR